MAMTIADLVSSPDNYLHSFDGDDAIFVPMDFAAYRRSIFLDSRISPAGEGAMPVPVSALAGAVAPGPGTGWIFHVAHCGSTLLSRALEELSPASLVLKEPAALRQLGFDCDPSRLDLVLGMLARRYDQGAMTIVKANVPVNFILSEIAARRPADTAIALYWKLDDYLVAILRSDNHRQWLRGISSSFAGRLGVNEASSDAERGAALWLAQMEGFLALIGSWPGSRSLDAARLFADPAGTLREAAALLGIDAGEHAARSIAGSSLFGTYSKRPDVAFGNVDRLARAEAVRAQIGEEIAAARGWLSSRGIVADALEARLAGHALGS